jgi:hypothetical protein
MGRPRPLRSHVRSCILRVAWLATLLATGGATANAHTRGENYVFANFREGGIDGRFEIHVSDLSGKLNLDVSKGGEEMRRAVDATAAKVYDYIREHFAMAPEGGGADYPIEFTTRDLLELPQGTFVQYHFRMPTGPLPDRLQIRHSMLYEDDWFHRGLLLVEYNAKTRTHHGEEYVAMVFGPASSDQVLDLTAVPGVLRARDMIWQGVLHIWIGIDHILFLVALMLPTVLVLGSHSWTPVSGFRRALWNLLRIVTVFTIAHSITLLLAALGVLDVPSRLVESVIALSIILVALNNITGFVREGSLLIILCLGLFHGLGFASVMGHLPLRVESLLKGVVGFNIGVELGQLAIVSLVFPLLFLLRRQALYVPVVLRAGSAVLVVIAAAWFVQRAFGLA